MENRVVAAGIWEGICPKTEGTSRKFKSGRAVACPGPDTQKGLKTLKMRFFAERALANGFGSKNVLWRIIFFPKK
jgi:hypothetical protein